MKGVETANVKDFRRVSVTVEALQYHELQAEPKDDAVECLIARGPDMSMTPQEEAGRAKALDPAVEAAAVADLQENYKPQLRQVLLCRWNALRCAFRGDHGTPSCDVEVSSARCKGLLSQVLSTKTSWQATSIATLIVLGLGFPNPQAVWAGAAMAVPKKGGCRFVSDYRAADSHIEKETVVMPNQEVDMARLRGAHVFRKLDCFRVIGKAPSW